MKEQLISLIITSLLSGLLATVITIIWQQRNKVSVQKLDIFKTLMTYRFQITAKENVTALNAIDVFFHKDKTVRAAYREFLSETDKKPEADANIEDKYLKLLEEIAKEVGLSHIKWDEIKRFYYPTGLAEAIQDETMLRKVQIESGLKTLRASREQNSGRNMQVEQKLALELLPLIIQKPEVLKTLVEFAKQTPQEMRTRTE